MTLVERKAREAGERGTAGDGRRAAAAGRRR